MRVLHYGESKEFFWKEEQYELGKNTLGKIAQMVEPSVLHLTKNLFLNSIKNSSKWFW